MLSQDMFRHLLDKEFNLKEKYLRYEASDEKNIPTDMPSCYDENMSNYFFMYILITRKNDIFQSKFVVRIYKLFSAFSLFYALPKNIMFGKF